MKTREDVHLHPRSPSSGIPTTVFDFWLEKTVTSSSVLRKGSLQTKLNAGLSE